MQLQKIKNFKDTAYEQAIRARVDGYQAMLLAQENDLSAQRQTYQMVSAA